MLSKGDGGKGLGYRSIASASSNPRRKIEKWLNSKYTSQSLMKLGRRSIYCSMLLQADWNKNILSHAVEALIQFVTTISNILQPIYVDDFNLSNLGISLL